MNKLISSKLIGLFLGLSGIGLGYFLTSRALPQVYASTDTTSAAFVSQYSNDVKKAAKKYNLYASVMMGQAALESGWGKSQLTQNANNFFGIKGAYNGQSVSMPTIEYDTDGEMQKTVANFKKYPSAYDSFSDNGSTLRNGTSWNSSYYSGTWKENADTYTAAANALTGKYATAPGYGGSIINIIQDYGFDKLFNEATGNSPTSNSANPASKPSTPTVEPPTTPKKRTYDKVKYYGASGTDKILLSTKFSKYYLYNHVKGATANVKRSSFKSLGVTGRVYVYPDMRGIKTRTKTTWYRIKFSTNKTAHKYWIYAPALKFDKSYTTKVKGTVVLNTKLDQDTYNHVVASTYLAKAIGNVRKLNANKKYSFDVITLKKATTGFEVWYRIRNGKTKEWVIDTSVIRPSLKAIYFKAGNSVKIGYQVSTSAFYNHIPAAVTKATKYSLKATKLTVGKTYKADRVGYDPKTGRLYYRISNPLNKKTYWAVGNFLE